MEGNYMKPKHQIFQNFSMKFSRKNITPVFHLLHSKGNDCEEDEKVKESIIKEFLPKQAFFVKKKIRSLRQNPLTVLKIKSNIHLQATRYGVMIKIFE